ncbi:TrbC/VirB2 family protein [Francisellaceae bacterium]|jgi:type IV secretion system protein VirB2|nr:TrbC/VirB2 family protein [Francisellaceae bacterium]
MKKNRTLVKYTAFLKKLLISGAFFSLTSAAAFATDSGEDMPWMSPLQTITASISGPIAQAAGVIVIVIAGLGIAFGEGGSGVRKLFQVVMGLAIAFTAASIVSKLFGATSGVAF